MSITSGELMRILKTVVTDPIVAAINSLRPKDNPTVNTYVTGDMDPEEFNRRVRAILSQYNRPIGS